MDYKERENVKQCLDNSLVMIQRCEEYIDNPKSENREDIRYMLPMFKDVTNKLRKLCREYNIIINSTLLFKRMNWKLADMANERVHNKKGSKLVEETIAGADSVVLSTVSHINGMHECLRSIMED